MIGIKINYSVETYYYDVIVINKENYRGKYLNQKAE